MPVLFLIGRILYGGFLLYSGYNHFANLTTMSTYTASKGVPAARVAVGGTGALLILGGLSILLGVWVQLGVLLVLIFFAGVTYKMHAFWADTDPMTKRNNRTNFLKNVALAGAALMFLAIPQPWALSLGVRIAM
jgi:putative oxidoreductase